MIQAGMFAVCTAVVACVSDIERTVEQVGVSTAGVEAELQNALSRIGKVKT